MAKPISNPQIALKPQDLVVLLRLSLAKDSLPTYAQLADELGITASEIHASLGRAQLAQLVYKNAQNRPCLILEAFKQFVLHGARYAFPAMRGEMTRGMATLYAAPPFKDKIVQPNEPPPVWPSGTGDVRGITLHPLYPSVPGAAQRNPDLYELLVLFDALRAGSARERNLAQEMLSERLSA